MHTPVDEAKIFISNISQLTDVDLAIYQSWLSGSETLRYQAFLRPLRMRQFLVGRILLRQSLADLLGVPVNSVRLVEQVANAPRLDWPDNPDIGFSLSHSGDWVACAVSAGSKLGLDIELLNADRDFSALALHAFDAEENTWLNQQDATNRVRDFYRLWTSKEARFKLNATDAQCLQFRHPELAISLCSARPLTSVPQLVQTVLSAE